MEKAKFLPAKTLYSENQSCNCLIQFIDQVFFELLFQLLTEFPTFISFENYCCADTSNPVVNFLMLN